MRRWQIGMALAAGAVVAAALWWLPQAVHEPARPQPGSPPALTTPQPAEAPEAAAAAGAGSPEAAPAALPAAAGSGDDEAREALPDPFGDLAFYAESPMSQVPHRVVRAWGAGPDSRRPGNVGAYVIVDPDIGDEALAQLAADIQSYHRGAEAVAVRILDDESAATYDRHSDGGEFLEQHLIGRVHRNDKLQLESIELRGEYLVGP